MQKPVFLDRDGVINVDSPDYIKTPDEFHPIAGSLEAIARWSGAGYAVVLITNQSGLARGIITSRALAEIHSRLEDAVVALGGRIQSILICPHLPDDGCACRKPRTGLLERASRELGLVVRGAPMIGDRRSDLEAARAAGCRPILVRTGQGRATEATLDSSWNVAVFDDLLHATEALLPRNSPSNDPPSQRGSERK